MRRVDFFVSNDRHHVEMVTPVMRSLARADRIPARVLSLCELRGMQTPTERLAVAGATVVRVVPGQVRPSPAVGKAPTGAGGLVRRLARVAAWQGLLAPRLRRLLAASTPDLAVLPNDAVYPYDRIVGLLAARGVPFLLLQEGIRFPLPGADHGVPYGAGGAAAVAAWGRGSADYFRSVGVPAERIHLTGSPRYDRLSALPRRPAAPVTLEGRALLLATNPIDDQGFCSTAAKHALVQRFLAGLAPLVASGAVTVVLKPHARESAAAYAHAATAAGVDEHTRILVDAPLDALFASVDVVVILASTVGLEALQAGKRLGVLAIPGFGFVHDYVGSGAAVGLDWNQPMHQQVAAMLRDDPAARERSAAYLRRHLAVGEGSSDLVGRLIAALVERRHGD